MKKVHISILLPLLVLAAFLLSQAQYPVLTTANSLIEGPGITVWYEDSNHFGHIGIPQDRVNIVGNVHSATGIFTLEYSLNGDDEIAIPVGPDERRLQDRGDFNIAIDHTELKSGENDIKIITADLLGRRSEKDVSIQYQENHTWPLPYRTHWETAQTIQEQAQVVDGLWELRGDTLYTTKTGYDRVIAIGDMQAWSNFEVLVPVTIHRFTGPSDNPGGVGIIARWHGHAGEGVLPHDWTRFGAYAYYSMRNQSLAMRWNREPPITNGRILSLDQTYTFKLRAEYGETANHYSFKVWPISEPEPEQWDLVLEDTTADDLETGSILLVAHYAEVSFGNVVITPLESNPVGKRAICTSNCMIRGVLE